VPRTFPERHGSREIDLSRADCDLSGVEAGHATVAGREKPARHHVRRPLPNGVIEAPAHRIQDNLAGYDPWTIKYTSPEIGAFFLWDAGDGPVGAVKSYAWE